MSERLPKRDMVFGALREIEYAGDWPALYALAQECLQHFDDTFEPFEALGLACSMLQRHQEALDAYELALALYTPQPTGSLVADALADALVRSGIAVDDRRKGRMQFNLACELAFLGREEEALDVLETCARETPSGHWACEAHTDSYFDSVREHPRFRAIVDPALEKRSRPSRPTRRIKKKQEVTIGQLLCGVRAVRPPRPCVRRECR